LSACGRAGLEADQYDTLHAEARGGRFYPGQGEIPLAAILDSLPEGLPIGVEAPCADYMELPLIARAALGVRGPPEHR
jgi:hypothetical protein